MAGRPAATMLHVGPGLANAWSALHNAAKAGSGILNIVGQLSEAHLEYESPLKSDILGLASSVSAVVCQPLSSRELGVDARTAAAAARQGKVATLLMANDIGWSASAEPLNANRIDQDRQSPRPNLDAIRALQKGAGTLLLLGGGALDFESQQHAAEIAAATGCSLMLEWASAKCERGGGLPPLIRIPYHVNDAIRILTPFDTIVLCGAREPIAFFNYRDMPSRLARNGTTILELQTVAADYPATLREVKQTVTTGSNSPDRSRTVPVSVAGTKPGAADTIGKLIAAALPEGAIVVNEAITSVGDLFTASAAASRHAWLDNLGGSIGFALPVSIGAAIAEPSRRVVALCGDGSTMYSVQALWTIARENLNVTMLIFANNAYQVLINELARSEEAPLIEKIKPLLRLDNPLISWTDLSRSLGIKATHAKNTDQFRSSIFSAMHSRGPNLIEIAI
jgi:acetolactate synthase-1/2/3 large subunit